MLQLPFLDKTPHPVPTLGLQSRMTQEEKRDEAWPLWATYCWNSLRSCLKPLECVHRDPLLVHFVICCFIMATDWSPSLSY
jgi:hypothetical protein